MKQPVFFIDIFLQPGELFFGDCETRIRTLLGSCVAITLWHPTLRIGGMCHYMLPGKRRIDRKKDLDGRYADEAIMLFMRELEKNKTVPSDYEVKMFGGGDQFPSHFSLSGSSVSDNNIAIGRALLKQYGFHIKAEHLGGTGHRNVIFDLWTGHVWMKHVARETEQEKA
jgi:chemotaxis protein CheD